MKKLLTSVIRKINFGHGIVLNKVRLAKTMVLGKNGSSLDCGEHRLVQKSIQGMTLAEVMMASASASLILTGLLMMFLMINKINQATSAQLYVQTRARTALDYTVWDVRRAERASVYANFATNSSGINITATNADFGSYVVFQLPTNTLAAGDQRFHHYYMGSHQSPGNGITNARLYFFTCASETNLATKSATQELVRGITNPEYVFDWINGVINLNIRIADENDADGKQIIYLRSSVAFRNGD
jgi:Tfp pilus assembly protein PilV